jgi:hypothetical protein
MGAGTRWARSGAWCPAKPHGKADRADPLFDGAGLSQPAPGSIAEKRLRAGALVADSFHRHAFRANTGGGEAAEAQHPWSKNPQSQTACRSAIGAARKIHPG